MYHANDTSSEVATHDMYLGICITYWTLFSAFGTPMVSGKLNQIIADLSYTIKCLNIILASIVTVAI